MKIYKDALNWLKNASLSRKIVLLVLLVAILPLGVTIMTSLWEVEKMSQEQRSHTENQGFVQVFQAVEDKLDRMKNIATLLAMDDGVVQDIMCANEAQSTAEQMAYFNHLSDYLNRMELAFRPYNIIFYVNSNLTETGDQTGRFRSADALLQENWFGRLRANNGNSTWVRFQEPFSDASYIAIVREIWDPNDYQQTLGVLAVLLSQEALEEMLVPSSQAQELYLETADGMVLASDMAEDELVRVPLGERGLHDSSFFLTKVDGMDYLQRSQMMAGTSIYMVSLIPKVALMQEMGAVNTRLQIIYVAICALSLLAMIPLTRSITKRMTLLKEQMMRTQNGVISRLEGQGACQDEIGQLIGRYNDMVDKVEDLLQEQYEMGQKKTEAELKALQSQINPHFLYNTLDMIKWMAQKEETDNVQSIVDALSRFYRLTMSKGHDIITIGDELVMCQAYMEIQNCRYQGDIFYQTEVEEAVKECLIPKITLQPFLENAIVHGINEKEDAMGSVLLRGKIEGDRVILSVTDDGVGMREGEKSKTRTGSQYGMENIAQRLELFFGERIPIQIESAPGIGTCIRINIPMRTSKE